MRRLENDIKCNFISLPVFMCVLEREGERERERERDCCNVPSICLLEFYKG